jgi:hypothetical protein
MSAFKRSAVSVGTSDMSPPDVGSSIGPISLHNAIEGEYSEVPLIAFNTNITHLRDAPGSEAC